MSKTAGKFSPEVCDAPSPAPCRSWSEPRVRANDHDGLDRGDLPLPARLNFALWLENAEMPGIVVFVATPPGRDWVSTLSFYLAVRNTLLTLPSCLG